jgi:hypothetical protein
MNREFYFQQINSIDPPLLFLPNSLELIINNRTSDLSESTEPYFKFADMLSQFHNNAAKSRAEYIRMQCRGIPTKAFFEKHQESWGIPKFKEELVTDDDFKNGFLYTFRDHTTSWCEDTEARQWFFKNIEARFVRHYRLFSYDNGLDEIIISFSGNYGSIMWEIVKGNQDYSALSSPFFTRQDLQNFYIEYDEAIGGFDKETILEYLQENPNWQNE